MNITIIGKPFGNGVNQAKDKFSEDTAGRKTIESTYRTLWSGWLLTAPVRGSAHPSYPTATLTSKTAQQITPGYLCDVTLTYVDPDISNPPTPGKLPPNEYTESANEIEMPIEAHPDFATFATAEKGAIFDSPIPPLSQGKFLGWTKSSPYAGYLTFKVGSITESETTYFWTKPPSCADLVGKRAGDHYLVVSGSIARRYPYWTRTINRIYSSVPWNSTIYPNT
jgi:hypothetical protein